MKASTIFTLSLSLVLLPFGSAAREQYYVKCKLSNNPCYFTESGLQVQYKRGCEKV